MPACWTPSKAAPAPSTPTGRRTVTVTVEHAALNPFRSYANAIRDEVPDAVAVLDAFHVVRLGSNELTRCAGGYNSRP